MYANTTEPTTFSTHVSTEVSERLQTVYLSGPIKILLPISACEEIENLDYNPRDLHFDASASIEVGANIVSEHNKGIPQLSHPIDIKAPAEKLSDIIDLNSSSATKSIKLLSSTMDKSSTAVKQPDPDHPKEIVSPL